MYISANALRKGDDDYDDDDDDDDDDNNNNNNFKYVERNNACVGWVQPSQIGVQQRIVVVTAMKLPWPAGQLSASEGQFCIPWRWLVNHGPIIHLGDKISTP
jgi:hypothetical protein